MVAIFIGRAVEPENIMSILDDFSLSCFGFKGQKEISFDQILTFECLI